MTMWIPHTRSTKEGTDYAIRWLEDHPEAVPQLRQIFQNYYREQGRDFPWRHTRNPYEVLVAEILLQKTSVRPVEHIWSTFIERFPDAHALAAAPLDKIEEIIGVLGIRRRSRALREAAKMLVEKSEGSIIGDWDFLTSLPGVGTYAAAAILSFALDIPAATVDVNAARVWTRICGLAPKTLRQALALARTISAKVITSDTHREVNLGVLDLSAQLCRPTAPRCDICPALPLCHYGSRCAIYKVRL